jgi:hypothetical protein
MPCWTGKWKGGRTYRTQEGRTVYVLRKMVQGKHYEITLEARNEMEAEAELALFLRGPGAYQTRSEAARTQNDAAVYLDAETVGRFLEYLQGQGRTARYVRDVGTYLAAWAEALAGRNLRRLTLQEVLRELARHKTARKNRITALKSFTAWLREVEAVLPVAEDCTLALKVPLALGLHREGDINLSAQRTGPAHRAKVGIAPVLPRSLVLVVAVDERGLWAHGDELPHLY